MKERYDVIVVGAGPAGLLAAKALAQNGFDVAVLDRKKDPSAITRACGQSLLPPNEYFFGDIFHYNAKDKRFCFSASGISFPYTGPVKNLYNWHMFSPSMKKMQFGLGEPSQGAPIALSYDKDILIKCLLEDIQCDHVDVFTGTECTDFQMGPGCVVVQAGDKAFIGSYVIAADGANSRIVEKLGFNNNRRHISTLYVKSCFIKGFHSPQGDSIVTAVTYINDKPVYLFLLPRAEGDEWNLIVLTLEGSVDLTLATEAILKDARYAAWFKGVTMQRDFAFSKPEVIDYIFGLMGAESFPATFNPYTAVGLLGGRLQSLMPKIMAERPDILQLLAGTMSTFPSDVMGQTLKK
ncbi:MAG: FAD-dependent monooxygenase [Proteobacteria bacterium]|nr:FAD-dependent monooxygenase [Pseudomonadota bacterium]